MGMIPESEINPEMISAYQDPDGEAPWAMPIVVQVSAEATHEDAIIAASRATVELLHAATEEGNESLAETVARWRIGRIRKVVRRAKGASWDRALNTGNVFLSTEGQTTAAAFAPCPVDELPADLARLQVSGLDLLHREPVPMIEGVPTVALTPYLSLTTGKACAQAAHALQLYYESLSPIAASVWAERGFLFNFVLPDEDKWREFVDSAAVIVHDAGFTEIPAGSRTALCFL